jgi:tetratricopeptide (TPR) repeat protein
LRWPVRQAADAVAIGPPEVLATSAWSWHSFFCGTSSDGRVLGLANYYGAVLLRRDRPGQATWLGPHHDCRFAAISPNGRWAATGSHSDQRVAVWDAVHGELARRMPERTYAVVRFSPDGRWLASSDRLWKVGIWEPGPTIASTVFGFLPAKGLAASASGPFLVLSDVESGRVVARLEDPRQDNPGGTTFSPDGSLLIAANDVSRTIHIWDLRRIRRGLAELGLDWDLPPDPPDAPPAGPRPRRATVDYGAMEPILGDPQRLLSCYAVALAFRPLDAELFYRRAVVLARLERWDPALADARAAAAIAPDDRRAHFLIGRTQLKLGHLADAVASLRRALACPRRPDAFPVELGEAHLLNRVAWECVSDPAHRQAAEEALPLIRAAMEILPLPIYRNTLGVVYYRLGRHRDAIACFERSLGEQDPDGLPADLYFLAMSYHRAGDADRARACFHRAGELQASAGLGAEEMAKMDVYRAEAERTLGTSGSTPPSPGRAPDRGG